jgi:hypothetical protein
MPVNVSPINTVGVTNNAVNQLKTANESFPAAAV